MLLNNNPKFNAFKENVKAKIRPGKKTAVAAVADDVTEKEAD